MHQPFLVLVIWVNHGSSVCDVYRFHKVIVGLTIHQNCVSWVQNAGNHVYNHYDNLPHYIKATFFGQSKLIGYEDF